MAPSKVVAVAAKPDGPAVDPDQIMKASKALLAHMRKASKEKAANADKKNLLAGSDDEDAVDEEPIWLALTTKRHVILPPRLLTLYRTWAIGGKNADLIYVVADHRVAEPEARQDRGPPPSENRSGDGHLPDHGGAAASVR